MISAEGIHFSEWDGGSSYGSLSLKFVDDSLYYEYSQN